MRRALVAPVAAVSLSGAPLPAPDDALILGDTLPANLSEFRLVSGPYGRRLNAGVEAYTLHTPLFSDYAEKWRAAYVPAGQKIGWRSSGPLDFPVGSVLIKSFGYSADLRAPGKDVRMLETRLLIRRASGWVALPYVWSEDGSDAVLRRAGTRIPVSWTHLDGTRRTISYAVPNSNQCKGCHVDASGQIGLIGPKARNLARFDWGRVEARPASHARMPVWNDPKSGTVAARARAYLDVNCGHCHNPTGPADTSGLWLNWEQALDVNYGLNKRPTAAGRGSGGHEFAVAPGQPRASYLPYRMKSLDPGIAMPELGRATVHDEGVALVEQWIRELPSRP